MNNTPTPRERFRKTLDISTGVSELLADSNTSYISWLESELAAVTELLKAAQDGWHDEITKGLSELRRAESIYTKAQERAEKAEEQRDRLAGLKYPEALTVDFVKMLIETVKCGGKVVTFNDGDIHIMERILKGGADE